MSDPDKISFVIDFSLKDRDWLVDCAVISQVRKYPDMNYKSVDIFMVERARCPVSDTELTGDQWEAIIEATGRKRDFYDEVTFILTQVSLALEMPPYEA